MINTSRYEGFSNTFIQAWRRKVPVVSLDVNPDNVLNREGIGLFSDGSYGKLKESVLTLIRDEELMSDMAKHAQEYALARHSIANIERLIDIFDSKSTF